MCLLSDNIHDYHYVSQGKTTIPNVDDGEELTLTDVRNDSRRSIQTWAVLVFFKKKISPQIEDKPFT